MDVLKAMEEKAFWGHEFLTWLWFRSETEGTEMEAKGVGPAALWIEDRLVLESLDSDSRENTLKAGDVAGSAEAAAAGWREGRAPGTNHVHGPASGTHDSGPPPRGAPGRARAPGTRPGSSRDAGPRRG